MDTDDNPWAETPGSSSRNPIAILDPEDVVPTDPPPTHAPPSVSTTGMEGKNELLLMIFIHGFKGSSDTTFEDFPSRLTHNLQETYPGLHVRSLVYPTYDTRGSLAAAVEGFVEWLTEKTVQLESKPEIDVATGEILPNSGKGGGLGSVKIVLSGHSMGGLVAVDAALAISESSKAQRGAKLWPRVVGVIAYDTPYYGVHPGVFKNGINKYAGYIQTAQNLGTYLAPVGVGLAARWGSERKSQAAAAGASRSTGPGNETSAPATKASGSWRSTLLATGAVALASGAAASAAYFNKEKLNGAYGWVTDHMAFVSNLWDDVALRQRLEKLVDQPQILFHCFYTRLPANSTAANPPNMPIAPRDRTFIILPPRTARAAPNFTPVDNTRAPDEVDAHISMFSAKNNPLYFDLGLRSAGLIATCLDNESRYGDQRHSQQETADSSSQMDEEKGLRAGDEEIEILKASSDYRAKQEPSA